MGFRFNSSDMLATIRIEAKEQPKRLVRSANTQLGKELEEAKRRTPVWNPARQVPPGHVPGTLRASGKLEVEQDGRFIRGRISFGGLAEEYAFFVHEDTEAFHATGQDHFLSSVLNESRPYILQRIGDGAQLKGRR